MREKKHKTNESQVKQWGRDGRTEGFSFLKDNFHPVSVFEHLVHITSRFPEEVTRERCENYITKIT